MKDYFEYDIPAKRRQVLDALHGSTLTRMVRFSWEPGAELNRKREEWGLSTKPDSTAFSLASGPVLMWLDSGAIVGACSESGLISVILGFERDETGAMCDDPVESDEGLHPIEATDEQYSSKQIADVIGKRIVRVSVLKRQPNNAKAADRPRESGVVLEFEGGNELVLSHGLFYKADDDFQVIPRSQIHPAVVPELDEYGLENINALTLASRFRDPDVAAFETQFGCKIPRALLRLYSLGESLMNSPGNVSTEEGGVWIQYFIELSAETVSCCNIYEWKCFAFAAGGENQAYLISIEDPNRVFIDYESDGSDIEELSVGFEGLVDELLKRPGI